jgi:hypothetical protein
MVEEDTNSCSPYLLKERRELAVACRQISEAHGQAAPPCGACGWTHVCRRRRPRATLIALPRPERTPSKTPGTARAA